MDILDFAAVTHRGTVKQVNEDSILADSPVFVVADGISGSNRGDIASQMVTRAFAELLERQDLAPDLVADTLQRAHAEVMEAQRRDHHDSATTACGAVGMRMGEVAYWIIFNIGDSRVYRISGNRRHLTQVSVDHSHVQELVEAGVITEAQAEQHPDRNVITRAVGAGERFRPDFWLVPMVNGDRLLLCSDGLLRESELSAVAEIARSEEDPERAVRRLLDLALGAGARDNVSIIVVDVHSQPAQDVPETGRELG
ncbi:serine/threonine-protein phosphatase [Naumannella sp. ID2617S]|uniref:PP2C family protein-serine/threonine phosphatase n=1 Tax=Enemella dayhoffiae TaxID=2016507 RepID=UPI00148A0CBB|nr:protein phosphatase 2C domain-containing protein [Enemella dayhoffiae]NNG20680.1 serine/threonine-protein phosphatase [Naumannella sp. ID2617S]